MSRYPATVDITQFSIPVVTYYVCEFFIIRSHDEKILRVYYYGRIELDFV